MNSKFSRKWRRGSTPSIYPRSASQSLPFCLSLCLSLSLSLSLSIPPFLSVPLSLCLFLCPSLSLPFCLSLCLSLSLSLSLSISLSPLTVCFRVSPPVPFLCVSMRHSLSPAVSLCLFALSLVPFSLLMFSCLLNCWRGAVLASSPDGGAELRAPFASPSSVPFSV